MSLRAFAQEFDINLATGKVSEESDLDNMQCQPVCKNEDLES